MSFFRTKPNTGPNGTSSHPPNNTPLFPPKPHGGQPFPHNSTNPTPTRSLGFMDRYTTPMSPHRRRRLWKSYGLDWALTIIVWAIFYALDKVNGYRRLFSITDTSLMHPYAEDERIPVWALALIAGIFPLVVILAWAGGKRKSWFDAQVGALGLGLGLGLSSTFTNIIKVGSSDRLPSLLHLSRVTHTHLQHPLVDHSRQTQTRLYSPLSTSLIIHPKPSIRVDELDDMYPNRSP